MQLAVYLLMKLLSFLVNRYGGSCFQSTDMFIGYSQQQPASQALLCVSRCCSSSLDAQRKRCQSGVASGANANCARRLALPLIRVPELTKLSTKWAVDPCEVWQTGGVFHIGCWLFWARAMFFLLTKKMNWYRYCCCHRIKLND